MIRAVVIDNLIIIDNFTIMADKIPVYWVIRSY